jgi:hypothetical protein
MIKEHVLKFLLLEYEREGILEREEIRKDFASLHHFRT